MYPLAGMGIPKGNSSARADPRSLRPILTAHREAQKWSRRFTEALKKEVVMTLFATSSTAFRRLWSIALLIVTALLTALLLGMAAKVRAAEPAALPVITEVSRIWARQTQTITISGRGFGTMIPYNGD